MSVQLLLCEASGARLILTNSGRTQTGTDFVPQLMTWDLVPSGEVGDNSFRTIDVSGSCTNGYTIAITPYIDGVAQTVQTFSGAGTGEFVCQAFVAIRGARVAALVTVPSRAGDIEIHNIAMSYVPIRRVP